MGVLEAVRGWDAYHGVEPEPVAKQAGIDPLATEAEILEAQANSYAAEEGSSEPGPEPEPAASEEPEETKAPQEDEWTAAKLDELARVDHVALLLEHARHISGHDEDRPENICAYYLFYDLHEAYYHLDSGYHSKLYPSFSCSDFH
jgi:hypothetical protein